MKKLSLLLSIASAFLLVGCGGNSQESTTTPEYVQDVNVFPKHHRGSGYIGDPMPYYENGKMYVYYLEDARNYGGGGYHPISLLETTNFTNYDDKGIMLNFVDDRYSIEFALATGSVIKDKTNKYHFFYGGYNDNLSFTGLPYAQTILHATSTDLYHWTKDPSFNDGKGYIIGNDNDFRDPYVLYMESANEYWMLITSRVGGVASILKYTSTDLLHWTNKGAFFQAAYNNMECSSLIRWNGYWYLSFSENGEHGYTKFYAKRNLEDKDWIEIPTLDGFYAGRPVIGENNRLFLYGWAPTKGPYDSVKPEWAGNLISLELTQQDGSPNLNTILEKEIKDNIAHEVAYKELATGQPVSNISLDKTSYVSSKAIEKIKENVATRISFDFEASENTGRCGITFANTSNNQLGSIAFDFNFQKNQLLFYNACQNNEFKTPEYVVKFEYQVNHKYHVDVLTQDTVTAVFLDNSVSLIMRTSSIVRNNWAFYAQNASVNFEGITFYE